MSEATGHTVHTRTSMVRGLQSGDEERWAEFYQLYSPVLRAFALRLGLTEAEADDLVQEACVGVARKIGEFRYDPNVCRFKTWLLNLASWRVKNQLAKRRRWEQRLSQLHREDQSEPERTPTIERVADHSAESNDSIWDQEWRANLMQAALQQVRKKVNATQFQIYDLQVRKQWPTREVARSLGVSIGQVYLAKHRVAQALKKEMAELKKRIEE
jgi:RNA polymerase sigma factor (sigma-70 family)